VHNSASREVALLFSGGSDSTLTALVLAAEYDRVHLITYRSFGIILARQSEAHYRQLVQRFGAAKFVRVFADNRRLHRMLLRSLATDYTRYCSGTAPGVLCLACKVAMHARTIIYCLEHGVPAAADGATRTQADHPECMPDVLNAFRRLYADYGIRFTSPIYDVGPKSEIDARLDRAGFTSSVRIGQARRFNQPICLVGPWSTLWHFQAPYVEERMVQYVRDKRPVVDRAIRPYFRPRGLDLAALRRPPLPYDALPDHDHRSVCIQSEFGQSKDLFLSRLLSPLWRGLDLYLRLRARRTEVRRPDKGG
jgi:7-cyano-7-deazaguanine synthase in queuosine biosynthesis